MRRLFALFCMASLSACAGGGSPQQMVPASQQTTQSVQRLAGLASVNWKVQVGASHDDYAEQDLDFYANSITIDAGDTVTYSVASLAGGDAHTVTFVPSGQKIPSPEDPNDVNPAGGTTVDGTKYVNSGILFGGQTFTLQFLKAGVYRILCLFHEPAMESTVVVQKAGTPYPHTAAFYRNAGEVDEWQDLDGAASSVALFPFKPGGTTLAAGISPGLFHGPLTQSTVLRFLTTGELADLPAEGGLTVKVGTVLTWMNESSNEPHTITFALAGQHTLPNINTDPAVNVVPPPGITTFDGTRIVNSGTILGGGKFMLKFTKPGSYFYGCLYHFNSRMTGIITVTP